MKTNPNTVLKVLVLGGALLINNGVGKAGNGTVGSNGKPTGVTCECIGEEDTPMIHTRLTGGGTTGYTSGGLGAGATSVTRGGSRNVLGGSVKAGQIGNLDGGGTFTYQNG